MNLAAVMDELATRLRTLSAGLHVHAYPPGSVTAPAAIVGYPDGITFDATYGRGMDTMTLPVVLVVGKVSDRTARDRLGKYCNGSGVGSVKAVLESGTYAACDSVRVTGIDIDTYDVAAVPYLAAIFDLDIAGPGVTSP